MRPPIDAGEVVTAHGGKWQCVGRDERGPLFVRFGAKKGTPSQRLIDPVRDEPEPTPMVTPNPVRFGPGAGLSIALSAAVPLRIAEYKARGGPDDADRDRVRDFAQVLGGKGDVLQYGGKPGEAASLFNQLADGLAVLSFQPGGVKAFGDHWQGGST